MNLFHQELLELISPFLLLNDKQKYLIQEAFEPISVDKQVRLEEEGKKTKFLYFIRTGFIRAFDMVDGEDRTTQINCPSRFITSFQSFVTHSHAHDNIETITPCQLLRISKERLDYLSEKMVGWNIFSAHIYNQAILFNEERTRDMILLSAEQRYLKLLNQQPKMIQNVPLQYIASYIGIQPESLSRIRRKLIS